MPMPGPNTPRPAASAMPIKRADSTSINIRLIAN
jgi:hypothetical protein